MSTGSEYYQSLLGVITWSWTGSEYRDGNALGPINKNWNDNVEENIQSQKNEFEMILYSYLDKLIRSVQIMHVKEDDFFSLN